MRFESVLECVLYSWLVVDEKEIQVIMMFLGVLVTQ